MGGRAKYFLTHLFSTAVLPTEIEAKKIRSIESRNISGTFFDSIKHILAIKERESDNEQSLKGSTYFSHPKS